MATIALLPAPAWSLDNQAQYQACMTLLERDPAGALDSAVAWERQGGGDAARHCVAASYMGLKQYDDAAMELERIAQAMPQVKAPMMAQLFGQAAQAWMAMNQPDRALNDINQGLKLNKNSVELLVLRATIYGNQEKYFEALDDLNNAADLAPDNADIYAMRAAAYRQLETLDLAQENVDQALKISPSHPTALLERGYLRRAKGDLNGARDDWLTVIQMMPNTDIANEAQKNIERLDIQ